MVPAASLALARAVGGRLLQERKNLMAGMDWFRWHHGSVTDPKFQLVAKKAGASTAEVLAVWACLLEEASQAENRGHPGDIDFEALDCLLGFEDGKALEIHKRMSERGLFKDGAVAAWDRRQPKREDDTAADRKRRQRERDHELNMARVTADKSRNVTQCHADVTQGHDRGEESREDSSVAKATGDAGQVQPAAKPEPDPIFGDGLAYLVKTGVPEKGARSFLGKMRKAINDDLVAVELLVKAQQLEVSDPVPWLRAAAQKRMGPSRLGGSNGVAL